MTAARVSCMLRGGRTAHPLSRKWRFTSPAIVGPRRRRSHCPGLGRTSDRLDEANAGHLDKVFIGDAPTAVARGDSSSEPHARGDGLIAETSLLQLVSGRYRARKKLGCCRGSGAEHRWMITAGCSRVLLRRSCHHVHLGSVFAWQLVSTTCIIGATHTLPLQERKRNEATTNAPTWCPFTRRSVGPTSDAAPAQPLVQRIFASRAPSNGQKGGGVTNEMRGHRDQPGMSMSA